MSPFPHPIHRATNQHGPRIDKLMGRLRAERDRMVALVAAYRDQQPELSAHLQSLVLYAEGKPLHEIKASTGLSTSAVLRVRRRFECWGLSCVLEARPRRAAR